MTQTISEKAESVLRAPVRRTRAPFAWALPAIILTVLFHYAAVIAGSWYAFTDWNGLSRPNFVGLANFRSILTDPAALHALGNTLLVAVLFVIGTNVVGMALALVLNNTLKTRFILRSLFFAPVVMSPLAVSYIWQFIYDVSGPVNSLFMLLGMDRPVVWLGNADVALYSVLAVMIWQFSGLCMAFYLAGLQNMPEELFEAAAVDGASAWRRFRKITFPLLAPAATVAVSMTTVIGLRTFDQIMALTHGGPGYATETLATQIYKQTFVYGKFGYGAAFALVLTVLVLIVSGGQIVLLRLREKNI